MALQPVLTQAQLDSFKRDGFLHIPGLIPPHELEAVQRDTHEMIQRGIDGNPPDKTYLYGEDATDANRKCLFRINGLLNEHKQESFRLLLAYPRLLTAISQAVGGDHFVSSVHSIVFKIPHRGFPVPWHQDPVKVCRFPVFNVDIYLDEANPGNGGLWAIPGSHLAGYHGTREFVNNWTEGKEEDAPGAVPVNTKPGDVVFHATSVLHGSFWNRSSSLRRTIYFHIDHLKDVLLQTPGAFPQGSYLWAQDVTAAAVELRKKKHPNEEAFPYWKIDRSLIEKPEPALAGV